MRITIWPWLASNSIREVCIRPTDSQVHHNIEFPVKRSSVALTDPWIGEWLREFPFSPEWFLLKIYYEYLIVGSIEISIQLSSIPVKTIRVKIVSQGFSVFKILVSQVVSVIVPGWAPMKSGAKAIAATNACICGGIVATRLHDVNFPGCGPLAVFVISGEHPNGWP